MLPKQKVAWQTELGSMYVWKLLRVVQYKGKRRRLLFIKRDKSSHNPEEETHCLPRMCQGFPVSKVACSFLWSLRV